MIYINLLIIFIFIVAIHEFGHYLAARYFGAKVTDFSIGFGKTIFKFTDKNNTIWKISIIPLGGYVKIKGLESIFNNYRLNQETDSFNSLNLLQKIIILLAPFLESMILMASLADIRIKGLNGQLIIKGIFIIYIATFYVWLNDDSESLEKTMTALDNYLEKAIKLWNYKY